MVAALAGLATGGATAAATTTATTTAATTTGVAAGAGGGAGAGAATSGAGQQLLAQGLDMGGKALLDLPGKISGAVGQSGEATGAAITQTTVQVEKFTGGVANGVVNAIGKLPNIFSTSPHAKVAVGPEHTMALGA